MSFHSRSTIIAEAGVNHNGDIGLALELVDKAAEAGADFVKFQTFKADKLASPAATKAAYQERQTGSGESQLDMLRRLELSHEAHEAVIARCTERGIGFLSTPFDIDSLELLTGRFGLSTLKLGSGELTNAPLLLAAGRSGARIILSTGMGTLAEVEEALGVLAFGMMTGDEPATRADFAAALHRPAAWDALKDRVTLLHCTTEYPAEVADTNLRAMATMRAAFGLRVGYSDHTEGSAVSIAAVALGAEVLEKHFTLDRNLPGPDHAASLEPAELADLVRDIRSVETAIGSGIKQPGSAELANRAVARKSLHVAKALKPGEVLSKDDLLAMRPGDGISPMDLWDVVGTAVSRAHAAGDALVKK